MADREEPPAISAVFARQVRRLREEKGWSQAELARRLAEQGHPLGQSRVSAIEAPGPEPRTVSIDQAQAFARVLATPVELLLSEEGVRVSRAMLWREMARTVELADLSVSRAVEHANAVRTLAAKLLRDGGVPDSRADLPDLRLIQINREEG